MPLTCTARALVRALGLAAPLLALAEGRQLGGDLLLDLPRLQGLVGGAHQVEGHLSLDRQGADALLTGRHLGGHLQEGSADGDAGDARPDARLRGPKGEGAVSGAGEEIPPEGLVASEVLRDKDAIRFRQ